MCFMWGGEEEGECVLHVGEWRRRGSVCFMWGRRGGGGVCALHKGGGGGVFVMCEYVFVSMCDCYVKVYVFCYV